MKISSDRHSDFENGASAFTKKTVGAVKSARNGFDSYFQKLDGNLKVFSITALLFVAVMFFAASAAFFSVVTGTERVLVPDVTGKELAEALIEMQDRELYPKIQLRYSNDPGDKGLILDQTPLPGAVVKAGRRVTLSVSQGVVVAEVDDYVGKKFDDVRIKLRELFSGSAKQLIVLADPLYEPDIAEAGTILRQNPPAGTAITDLTTLTFVVSRGTQYESTRIPHLVGMGVSDVLRQIAATKLVFDFTSRPAQEGEKPGTVVAQDIGASDMAENYSRIKAEFVFDPESSGTVSGLFAVRLTDYPYAVPMRIGVNTPDGSAFTLVSFDHPGGNLTVPYTVPEGSELVLYVAGREAAKQTAQSR
jgi:beta-lactam-binding protein with PASTA domain